MPARKRKRTAKDRARDNKRWEAIHQDPEQYRAYLDARNTARKRRRKTDAQYREKANSATREWRAENPSHARELASASMAKWKFDNRIELAAAKARAARSAIAKMFAMLGDSVSGCGISIVTRQSLERPAFKFQLDGRVVSEKWDTGVESLRIVKS